MDAFTMDKLSNRLYGQRVVQFYSIMEYGFVETTDGMISTFHIYVNGRSIGRSIDSFDAALVMAVAHKYEGANSRAGDYFCKMVGINETTFTNKSA
jgi:hypothetical protein